MTLEEFRQARRKAEELKKEIPDFYKDLLEKYPRYVMEREKNLLKIDALYYELENVKGVNYAKQRNTYNHDAHIEKYYSISDEITELEQENNFINACIKGLEFIRDSIKDTTLKTKITECYFNTVF